MEFGSTNCGKDGEHVNNGFVTKINLYIMMMFYETSPFNEVQTGVQQGGGLSHLLFTGNLTDACDLPGRKMQEVQGLYTYQQCTTCLAGPTQVTEAADSRT